MYFPLPLAPRYVLTHYGLQGITAKNGILLFLTKPPRVAPAEYVLALYVLLSRARKLYRSWFEEALVCHNPCLTQRMQFFEERSKRDVEAADLILSELGWFDHEYVRRTLSEEADHPKSKRPKTSH